jgi:hypothetical protein
MLIPRGADESIWDAVGSKCLVSNTSNSVCFAMIMHKLINVYALAKEPHHLHKPMRYHDSLTIGTT